jgi:GNAT superfamily N-acetyltransferase
MHTRWTFGDPVRLTRNVRDDGTYPGANAGDLLVRCGSIGNVVDIGTFLFDQIIYSVHFLDGDRVVGATTCLPLSDEGPEFQEAFVKAGYDIDTICYFGESILLPEYRGQGIGKAFFAHRQAHACSLPGVRLTTFCAVDRPSDHPLRPANYRPLDGLWTAQGYIRHPELQATFVWKEIGEATESPKTLTFWLKSWPTP